MATASPASGGRGENRQGRCTRCRCRRMFWFGRGRSLSPLVLCYYQLVQQCFALDGHAFLSVFIFMDSSEKMKLNVLYHHSEGNAIRSFHLYGQIHKGERNKERMKATSTTGNTFRGAIGLVCFSISLTLRTSAIFRSFRRPTGFPSFPTDRSLRPNSSPLNGIGTRMTSSIRWIRKCLRS